MTRILAIGDIHGCYRSLDLLFTLGDYVDRGPRSRQVIDRLCELNQSHQLVPLEGNHETMMIASRNGLTDARRWMLSGGSEALDSYNGPKGGVAQLSDVPKRHWEFLCNRLLPYWETKEFIFVHGSVEAQLAMPEQTETYLQWTGFSSLKTEHCSGKTVVCRHEMQDEGTPACNAFGVCIDTGAWNDGWLTCFAPELGQIWQANERGETRQSTLALLK